MSQENIVLVDIENNELGVEEKMKAHLSGNLHRAFSVFLFDNEGRTLIQKRASHKYHSPGKWSNSCCSHPRLNESIEDAAKRRLEEELGMKCEMEFKFAFIYRSTFKNNLIEHELDNVLIGHTNDTPKINTDEVEDYKWIDMEELRMDISTKPQNYSSWLRLLIKHYFLKLKNSK